MQFIVASFMKDGKDELYHTWKNDEAKYPAFLDDLAFLVQALLHLQEITGDQRWLKEAADLAELVIAHFSEPETGFFFYTPDYQQDIIVRKKEVYDSAVPSGNSVMAYNLWQLGILLDRPAWKQRALDMVSSLGKAIIKYPTSFGNWACLLQEIAAGTLEIAIMGPDPAPVHLQVLREYLPNRVLMSASEAAPGFPLLAGKSPSKKARIFLCRNYTCESPVFTLNELMLLINKPKKA